MDKRPCEVRERAFRAGMVVSMVAVCVLCGLFVVLRRSAPDAAMAAWAALFAVAAGAMLSAALRARRTGKKWFVVLLLCNSAVMFLCFVAVAWVYASIFVLD